MQSINFPFDSSALSNESMGIIKSNVAWLKRNGNPKVQLGGNCDERGTNEYNMVLGVNRAQAALRYIKSLGEDPSQFSTLSYGEELPLDPAHNEAAWAKNRRVDFDIK
jgi:peptidoglycan-associated lipoprotein